MSRTRSNESVVSTAEWTELNTMVSNLSSSDFTAGVVTDNDSDDNVTNNLSAEFISKHEERCPRISAPMTIRFADVQQVFLVKGRSKGADHRKMGYRQMPNPWRRHGALKILHGVGGWAPSRGKSKKMQLIKPGTPLSNNDPRCCQLSLHQDRAVLKQEFFKFKLNPALDSQGVSHSVGTQMSEACIAILHSKQQPRKNFSVKSLR